jgi:hypothetical protein
MTHFVGLDVSVKETSVCVVDDAGTVISEQKVPTEPADIIAVLTSLRVTYGGWGEFARSADPAAGPRQGRPLDCTASSFSSHHGAARRRPRREARAPCGTN